MMMIMHGMYKLWSREIFADWMGQVVETSKACVQCGECEEKCPYHLPIREMLVEHAEFYTSVISTM
jgi:predicted aldo/keto reductase-like oxidoreductase